MGLDIVFVSILCVCVCLYMCAISEQSEVKQLTVENEELKATMKLDKERLHALEAAMEELHRRGEICLVTSLSVMCHSLSVLLCCPPVLDEK